MKVEEKVGSGGVAGAAGDWRQKEKEKVKVEDRMVN